MKYQCFEDSTYYGDFLYKKSLTLPLGSFKSNYKFICIHCEKEINRGDIVTTAFNKKIDFYIHKTRQNSPVHLNCAPNITNLYKQLLRNKNLRIGKYLENYIYKQIQ